ncbi:MAG: serine/threonine-protein kinase [Cyanobacteria bacterium P01_F01_bin.150]
MKTHCTRPGCPRPTNVFPDLNDRKTLKTVQQKFCTACGMPQILGGRYIPLRLLGQGGFGAAFLAVDRYTPKMRQCVVKQFQPSNDLQPEQLRIAQDLFDREAEALEDLGNRHPQIPNLFAFFELQVPSAIPQKSEDYFYLVQEFIDGLNMEEELAQRGPFSEDDVLEILTEVLRILKFVHDHDAIHRDIKPSNVMRSRQGRIYLLDFGAVKQSTVGQGAKAQHSTGIYSMGFAPPEQMQGNKVYPATDLYALGVTCITLLTGKEPTDLYDSYSNTWNWQSQAKVSDRLAAIFNQMLKATPRERFQSADDVLKALGVLSQSLSMPGAKPTRKRPAPFSPPSSSSPISSPSSPSTTLQRGSGIGASQSSPTMPPPPPPPAPVSPAVAPSPPPVMPSVAPPPAPVQPPPVQPAPVASPRPIAKKISRPKVSKRSLSSFAVIKGALFTGFETGLLAIAALSFSPSLVGLGIIAAGFVGLGLLQLLNIVGGSDLPIFAVLGLLIALGYHQFFGGFNVLSILPAGISHLVAIIFFPIMAGLLLMAGAIVFLLVYRLLSRFL